MLYCVFAALILPLIVGAKTFRCNELLGHDNNNLLTFEYINPNTHLRGVTCVSFLNNRESILMYMEEETASDSNTLGSNTPPNTNPHNTISRKQAIGRARLLKDSPQSYTGLIHVLTNVPDNIEDLYDLDGEPFTFSIVPNTGLGTFSIKSRLASNDIVYIWHPRESVPNWGMHLSIPDSCGNSIETYTITQPIPQPSLTTNGIVCIFTNQPDILKFFSIGWRKAGVSGKIRRFVRFGSLKPASSNFLNINTGRIHSMEFPSCQDEKDLKVDRLAFKETLIATAVRSLATNSFILYGDIQEIWFDPQSPINAANIPNYPLVPTNFDSNYQADLKNIYGLPNNF